MNELTGLGAKSLNSATFKEIERKRTGTIITSIIGDKNRKRIERKVNNELRASKGYGLSSPETSQNAFI